MMKKLLISLLVFVLVYIPIDFGIGFALVNYKDEFANHAPIKMTARITGQSTLRQPDPHFHHSLRPMVEEVEEFGPIIRKYATNSLGLKDRTTREVPLAKSDYRILLLGDSFTEGIAIPFEDTWAGLLDSRLKAEGVEILNAGVVSYSPKLYYYKLKHLLETLGLEVSEVMIFVDPSDIADELLYTSFEPVDKDGDDFWNSTYSTRRKPLKWFEYSLLYRTLQRERGFDPWKATEFVDKQNGNRFLFWNKRTEWITSEAMFEAWGQKGLAIARDYMQRCISLCAKHNLPLTIGIYPWPAMIADGLQRNRYRQEWRNFATKHNLPIIDLFDDLIPDDAAERRRLAKALAIEDDDHYNESGHRLWADVILKQMAARSNLFPESKK